jgi:hypothetical protein
MAGTTKAVGMSVLSRTFAILLTLGLAAAAPASALAQAGASAAASAQASAPASQRTAPASPGQASVTSPSAAQAPGAPQPSTAAGSAAPSGQPAAGSASPAAVPASAAASAQPAGVATPVGSNPPQESVESQPYFAYLLIILAGIWFLAAIAGIIRLLIRPTTGPYAVPLPPPEQDRHFLSFVMPFVAIITVFVILIAFGSLFLWLASISPRAFDTEILPLAVDLFIVCFVMLVATVLALRGSGQPQTEVH